MHGDDALDSALLRRWHELWDRLLDACRPGAPLTDLLDAYDAAGVPPPPMPVARGLGLGFDLPLVTHALPRTAAEQHLEAGMVLALTAYVWQEGVGAVVSARSRSWSRPPGPSCSRRTRSAMQEPA